MLAKQLVVKPTPARPDGVTFLGGLAIVAGTLLLFAVISLAIPWSTRWVDGPGFFGFWITLSFDYVGFVWITQFLPMMWFAMIVMLGILYLAAGIGFFSGRRWAWTLAITLALVGVASTLLQIITWNQAGTEFYSTPGLIVTLLIFVYLISPLARNFFFKRR